MVNGKEKGAYLVNVATTVGTQWFMNDIYFGIMQSYIWKCTERIKPTDSWCISDGGVC